MEEQVVVVRGSREDRKQRAAPIEEGNKAVSYLSDKGDREVGNRKVSLVKHIGSGKAYAMKVLRKRRVLQFGELRCTMDEKRILELMVDKPFIAKLQTWSVSILSSTSMLGATLENCYDGRRLSKALARFYASELVDGISHLHKAGVVHRDIKPENILIDASGHIVITDFGLSKLLNRDSSNQRTNSLLWSRWWSFGIVLFELLVGSRPFEPHGSTDTTLVHTLIVSAKVVFPEGKVVNMVAQDLINGLLKKSPTRRYSENGIRQHAYFSCVRWVEVSQKRYTPPWVPNIDKSDALDTSNFQLDDEEPDPEPDLGFPPEGSTDSQGRDVFRGFSFDQADSARRTGTSGSTSPTVSWSAQETAKEGMPGPKGKENCLGGAILEGALGRMSEPEKNVMSYYDVLEDEQGERILRKRKRAGVSAEVADLPVKRTRFEHARSPLVNRKAGLGTKGGNQSQLLQGLYCRDVDMESR
ncbi:kinase-like protein [Atractiella rhizophila]|nr:kinase-like protein [Atractiella rhizophila]